MFTSYWNFWLLNRQDAQQRCKPVKNNELCENIFWFAVTFTCWRFRFWSLSSLRNMRMKGPYMEKKKANVTANAACSITVWYELLTSSWHIKSPASFCTNHSQHYNYCNIYCLISVTLKYFCENIVLSAAAALQTFHPQMISAIQVEIVITLIIHGKIRKIEFIYP